MCFGWRGQVLLLGLFGRISDGCAFFELDSRLKIQIDLDPWPGISSFRRRGSITSAFRNSNISAGMRKVYTAFLVLGTLLLSQNSLFSLPSRPYLRFERLLPETGGAPITGISSILQDRRGFLWFGTIAGLVRYDGYRFVFHSPQPGLAVADLSQSAVVFTAIEDSRGDIWIGTDG